MNFFRLQCFLLFIGMTILTYSCEEKGDEKIGDTVDSFIYDEVEYQIKDAAIRDFGKMDLLEMGVEPVYTHYDYDFILTDGDISFGSGAYYDVANASLVLEGSLVSPDTTEFKGGTFQNFDFSPFPTHEDLIGKYLFVCSLLLDMNGNGDPYDDEDDVEFYAVSGQISASGQPQEFTMDIDITLENGKALKGKITREFKYRDVSN